MLTYVYCSITISSNIEIPELLPAVHESRGFLFSLKEPKEQVDGFQWSHHWLSNNQLVLSYYRKDTRHWLRFPSLADFCISEDTHEIYCYPLPELPHETLRHLLLDQVLPRWLAYQGNLMLHASAVVVEGKSLLFIGNSGAGKSTLAGNFNQAGLPALSDDCLWLREEGGQVFAVPSYGSLRLYRDSLQALFTAQQTTQPMAHYSTKKRVAFNGTELSRFNKGIPVSAVFLLSPLTQNSTRHIDLDILSPRASFVEMMKQTFQLDLHNTEKMSRQIQILGSMIPKLSIYHLAIPHDYELLPLVREKILEKVA